MENVCYEKAETGFEIFFAWGGLWVWMLRCQSGCLGFAIEYLTAAVACSFLLVWALEGSGDGSHQRVPATRMDIWLVSLSPGFGSAPVPAVVNVSEPAGNFCLSLYVSLPLRYIFFFFFAQNKLVF